MRSKRSQLSEYSGSATCLWQEQGGNALNFQQSGFETAAQDYEQAAREEVHVVVAQAAEML